LAVKGDNMISKAIIMGRLGGDPEIRHTMNGKTVATANIATTARMKKGDKHTTWHKVIFFNKLGEVAGEYLKKGKLVYVEGNIQSKEWTDKEGKKHRNYVIVATNMVMMPAGERIEKKKYDEDDIFAEEDLPL